jgi:hypothetical protein
MYRHCTVAKDGQGDIRNGPGDIRNNQGGDVRKDQCDIRLG